MDIIIKAKSYKNLDKYIEMGANAFLFGINKFSINNLTNLNIRDIIKVKRKYKNIKIYISLNKNMFNKDLKELTNFLKEVDKLNIDGIFFYDLSILNIAKNINLKTNLVWNQNYFVNNYETCNYYYDKDIKYGVISNEITKEEIEKLVKNTKDALEKDDNDEIKSASEELSKKVMELSSRIYQEQAAEAQKASENQEETEDKKDKKDNVKDAEFEEK